MRAYSIRAAVMIMILFGSCKKDAESPSKPQPTYSARKVRYELFTYENFSGDKHDIEFNVHMRNGQTTFDSLVATMKVEDIPDSAHMIVVEKTFSANDMETLSVGFVYHIVNVGVSWYLEEFPAGDSVKVLKFRFR